MNSAEGSNRGLLCASFCVKLTVAVALSWLPLCFWCLQWVHEHLEKYPTRKIIFFMSGGRAELALLRDTQM